MNENIDDKLKLHLDRIFKQIMSLQEIKHPSISEQLELAMSERELAKILHEIDGEKEL